MKTIYINIIFSGEYKNLVSFTTLPREYNILEARLLCQAVLSGSVNIGEYSPIFTSPSANNNFLLTEREGRTGEYWPEVVAVQTSLRSVRTKTTEGQYSPVRLELARLVSSLLCDFLITFCFVFASA